MTFNKGLQIGILSFALAGSAFAAPERRDVQVVDVNRHIIPPGPPHARHVVIVNSAERAPRHHGVAGAFQRLHIWHMRQRAKIYRSVVSH